MPAAISCALTPPPLPTPLPSLALTRPSLPEEEKKERRPTRVQHVQSAPIIDKTSANTASGRLRMGSARVSRVGFGVAPKRTFPWNSLLAGD